VALRGLATGAAAGIAAAVGVAVARSDGDGSLWLAAALVLVAVAAGTAIGASAVARQAWRGLADLSPADRRVVVRTVAKGRAVEGPRLAPAVLGLAEHNLRRLTSGAQASPWRRRLGQVGFGLLTVSQVIGAFAGEVGDAERVLRLGLALVFAACAFAFAPLVERSRERAERAAAGARAVLDRSGGAGSLTPPGEGPP
jgi:hypothetical protein